jgi:tetratricopeptide (TPR) repeat protein
LVTHEQPPQNAVTIPNDDHEDPQRFYEKGLKHLKDGEWEDAIQYFRKALELQRDFPDAEKALIRAQHGRGAEPIFNDGLDFISLEKWDKAIPKLEEAFKKAEAGKVEIPGLSKKLEFAQRQKKKKDLHQKALQHEEAKQWAEAVATLTELCELDKNYEGAGERLAAASDELELQEAYKECQTQIELKDWTRALDIIKGIEEKRPDYPDIESLRVQVEKSLDEERQRKQDIDNELTEAEKALEDHGQKREYLQSAQQRLEGLKRRGYREDDIEDILNRIDIILRPRSKWETIAYIATTLGVMFAALAIIPPFLDFLFQQGFLVRDPTPTPTVVIPGIAEIEAYMNGGQLDPNQQLPSLPSGEAVELEVAVLDINGKRYTSDDLECNWSVAPLGDKDVGINTDQCKAPYTPSQEYSKQAVFVEIKGREQQFESSGHISMEFNITK